MRISDLALWNCQLMFATWKDEFFIKESMFSLLIGIMTCFLDGPLIVICILGFGLATPLTMLFIWSIFSVLRAGNALLILKTLLMLAGALETWAYVLSFFGATLFVLFEGFLFWKYFDITFTFLAILTGRGGGGRTLSIETGVSLGIFLFDF